jgi:hypothetical protein
VRRILAVTAALLTLAGAFLAFKTLGAVSPKLAAETHAEIAVQSDLVPDVIATKDVTWTKDEWPRVVKGKGVQGRTLDPQARRAIAATYARAWLEIERGIAATAPGVDPTFSGPALDAMKALRPTAGVLGARSHELQLRFYSDDGTTVSLQAQTTAITADAGTNGSNNGILRASSHDSYLIVLQLSDDATWRIRQWERVGVSSDSLRVEVTHSGSGGSSLWLPVGLASLAGSAALFAWFVVRSRRV